MLTRCVCCRNVLGVVKVARCVCGSVPCGVKVLGRCTACGVERGTARRKDSVARYLYSGVMLLSGQHNACEIYDPTS